MEIIALKPSGEPIGLLNDYLSMKAEWKRGLPGTAEIVLNVYDPIVPFLLDFPNNKCQITIAIDGARPWRWNPVAAQVSVLHGMHTCHVQLNEIRDPIGV